MTTTTTTKCPRCGNALNGEQVRNALSRKDNKTYVCSSCGTDEAMLNMTGGRDADVWPGYPGLAAHYRATRTECSYCEQEAAWMGGRINSRESDGDFYCNDHKGRAPGATILMDWTD